MEHCRSTLGTIEAFPSSRERQRARVPPAENEQFLIQVNGFGNKLGTMQNLRLHPWRVEPEEGDLEKNEWKIAWSNFLSVGVAEMDDEHRQFIARVNELNSAIVEIEDKAKVARALDLMLTEAAHHFEHEEQLLAQWNYPQTAEHTAKHTELREQFERVVKEFAGTDISFVWALKGLRLKQLLVEHLLNEDMKYRDFLRARGKPGPETKPKKR